jgi:uncharacterized protein YbjT (DUF2867 family)
MIVVTTPTGLIGHQVLENVLDSGESIRVIARDPSRLPSKTRERVEVVQGSHGDIDVVNQAFAGADAVFWLVPPDPHAESVEAAYVDFARPAAAALKSQGVKRVVGVSALGRGTAAARNAGYVTASLKMDDLIASFPVLGPEDLSFNDMAQIMSEVLGKPVRFHQIPGEQFKARLTGSGMSEAMAQGMLDMAMAKNQGLDNAEPRTPQSTTPTTFRQWCDDVLKPAVLT